MALRGSRMGMDYDRNDTRLLMANVGQVDSLLNGCKAKLASGDTVQGHAEGAAPGALGSLLSSRYTQPLVASP